MKIKTLLKLIIATTIAMLVGIVCSYVWLKSETEILEKKETFVRELNFRVFQSSQIRDEYFLYETERSRQQWFTLDKQINEQLNIMSALFTDSTEKTELEQLIKLYKGISSLFIQLTAYDHVASTYAADNRVRTLIISQMIGESHRLYQQCSRLSNDISHKAEKQLANSALYNLISLGLLGMVIVIFAVLIMRSVTKPLLRLRNGTRIIAGGEFTHRLDDDSSNEIGELARDFNQMSEQLASITVSRDELSMEVERRNRTEAALKESEDQFKKLFDESPLGIAVIDSLTGHIHEVNPMFAKIAGRSMDEMAAINWMSITHPDDIQEVLDNMAMLNSGDIPGFQMPKRYIRPDGTCVWISMTIATLSIKDKSNPCHLCMIEDITEQKKVVEQLGKSEERFRELFNSMVNGFALHEIILDETGTPCDYCFLVVNAAFERLTNLKATDVIGRRMLDIAPQTESFWIDTYGRVALTGEPCHFEHYSVVQDKHYEVNAYSPKPGQFACVFADISESKKNEQEKMALQNQLQQAQRLESVGSLAGGVAHDFNNKLSVILGHTYLALTESIPDQVQDSLEEIRKAAEQSADLTRQLLAYARKQAIAPKVLNLNETVAGILKMLTRLIGEDKQLAWQPASALWLIKFDPSQIDQILANLCVNARDAVADGGKIIIETCNSVIDKDSHSQFSDAVPGEYVQLVVSDNGHGMDKETLDRIFEPFFTTKEVGKGTGLGLATVFGIVKQNSGFINVYSEPGLGSKFSIYLPRYIGKNAKTEMDGKDMSAPFGRETILLVEDEVAILNMATTILSKQGYTVISASSANEAIRLAKEHISEINLLITDVIMPEMNGKDLAHNLQTFHPPLKCLYMSGYTADAIAQHGVLDEGVNFIQKPFSLSGLANKVREVLDSYPTYP